MRSHPLLLLITDIYDRLLNEQIQKILINYKTNKYGQYIVRKFPLMTFDFIIFRSLKPFYVSVAHIQKDVHPNKPIDIHSFILQNSWNCPWNIFIYLMSREWHKSRFILGRFNKFLKSFPFSNIFINNENISSEIEKLFNSKNVPPVFEGFFSL